MTDKKGKANSRQSFYEDLNEFVIYWLKNRNEEGEKPNLSEVIGGLEMAKNDIYWTQNWWMEKIVGEVSEKHLSKLFKKFCKKFEGKSIQINEDGSIIMADMEGDLTDKWENKDNTQSNQ